MALTASQLKAMSRHGGSTVATTQPDGSAVAAHPLLESWYAVAILDESAAVWGALYDEAMAAKTAHYCLMYPWNDDGIGRAVVTEEPLNGAPGVRKYKHDITDEDWWRSKPAGAAYLNFRRRIGSSGRAGPLFCT